MITKEQIKIFKKYRGDIDWIYRGNDRKAQDLFNGNKAWETISSLIQDIQLSERSLASEDYRNRTLVNIEREVDKDAIEDLYRLAKDFK